MEDKVGNEGFFATLENYDARSITDGKFAAKQNVLSNGNDTGVFHLLNNNVLRSLKTTSPLSITANGASHYTLSIADAFLDQSYTKIETDSLLDSLYTTGAVSKAFLNNSGQDALVMYNSKDVELKGNAFVSNSLSVLGTTLFPVMLK